MSVFSPDTLLTESCQKLGFDSRLILKELEQDGSEKSQTTIIKHVFNLTHDAEKHSILAGAIVMWYLYKEAPTNLEGYLQTFEHLFRDDVRKFFRLHQETLQKEVEKRYINDFMMNYFSVGTLTKDYLARLNYDESPMEIPQFCWLRIAVGEFASDTENALEKVLNYYSLLSNRECIAASPTMFNMGFKEGASSSCMIYSVDDSLDDILKVMYEAGMASKNNAGIGMDFSTIRHSNIGRHGISKGIIPLLKVWDDLTIYINQGGRRPGAMTVSTRVHHYDTPEFINLVDKTGEDENKVKKIRTSIMLSDLFIKRCQEGEIWTMFCPKQTKELNSLHGKAYEEKYLEYEEKARKWKEWNVSKKGPAPERIDSRQMPADKIMEEICEMQMKTGTPYIVHGCNLNRKNNMSNVGPVRSLNLCQEICIPAIPKEQTGCCNLASLSLKKFVRNGEFDFMHFGKVVRDNVLSLNRVIDVTHNVSEKVVKSNQMNRPIGVGVSGFAEMCYELDMTPVDTNRLPYEVDDEENYDFLDYKSATPSYSESALKERELNPELAKLNHKIWSCMLYNAYLESMNEAKKHGAYPNFWTSPTAQGKLQYHLWQDEVKETGRDYPFRLTPIEPAEWGQGGSWKALIQDIKKYGLRNALLLTCMPTASTAQILGNTESTEFPMQNIFTRKVQSGSYPVLNSYMVRDLQAIGLWSQKTYNEIVSANGSILGLSEEGLSTENRYRLRYLKEKYLTMWEIPQAAMIQLAAQRQVFIDHSQSFNVYIARPTVDTLKRVHAYTCEMGLKTGMYYLYSRAANDTIKLNLEQQATKETQIMTEATESVCKLGPGGECIGCQ